jgi:hypothetical protein
MQNGVLDEGALAPFATQLSDEQLADEKHMATFSSTKEFKKIKEYFEARIEFYQKYLPDGRAIAGEVPSPEQWAIANAIIGELNMITSTYLNAAEAVKDAQRKDS